MLRHSQLSVVAVGLLMTVPAAAQTSATPPADLAAGVKAATAPGAPPPPPPKAHDATNAAVSAGGQFATGNSRLAAVTGTGRFDIRRGANAFGFALVGNFAEAYVTPAPPPPTAAMPLTVPGPASWKESTENLQGKVRYDRYLTSNLSLFLQLTGTHDAFQAISFRLNVDPGVKLLFRDTKATKIWGEAGYDFQFDDNFANNLGIEQAGAGGPQLDPGGAAYVIKQNDSIHSSRLFAGLQHAFNKEVQLSLGLEYLQGFGGTGGGAPGIPPGDVIYNPAVLANMGMNAVDPVSISLTGSRLNFDALLAANVGAGLSVGIGFSAKYNSAPLAGKEDLDTATTLTLIYAFSGSTPEKPKTCPCPTAVPDAPPPGVSPSGEPGPLPLPATPLGAPPPPTPAAAPVPLAAPTQPVAPPVPPDMPMPATTPATTPPVTPPPPAPAH